MTSWLTTLGGIMAAIGLVGTQVSEVPPDYKWVFVVLAAAGTLLTGASAKDARVHSTDDEVAVATAKEGKVETK
jgi:hypothetical protein